MKDPTENALFERAMLAKGLNQSDIRMVQDIARHAAAEALKRMMAVTQTAPEHLDGPATLAAIAVLQAECSHQIDTLLEGITADLRARGVPL